MGFSFFGFGKKEQKRPDALLPAGWQFYSRPTNLEPPGTVFRIDGDGRRFLVDRLKPLVESGPEPGASGVERLEAKVGVVARFLGLQPLGVDVGGGRSRTLEFEIASPIRDSTTDVQIEKVLAPFLAAMEFRPKNRYFVIRDARSASGMKYKLSAEQFGEIGGDAVIAVAAKVGVKLSAKAGGAYEVVSDFPERLGVMFLPDEIAPVREGLAAGETALGRIPVTRPLQWVEGAAP